MKKTKADQTTTIKAVKKEKETSARTGGYDEQQVSELKAVRLVLSLLNRKTIFFIL